jgi:hypothetical protein
MKQFPPIAQQQSLVLVGCGILRHEVDFLIRKNAWRIDTQFLDSALHNYLNRLSKELDNALAACEARGEHTLVFYGSCHPLMDNFMDTHHTCRTEGQNCVVMLLGYELFMQELQKGAYFLLEDWALTWKPMITACFGDNVQVIREIFQGSHQYILALRTPCNSDFSQAAQEAADFVDLPLRWLDVDLQHLEAVLADAIAQRLQMQQ